MKKQTIIIVILLCLIAVASGGYYLHNKRNNDDIYANTNFENVDYMIIETDYCNLHYPDRWEDNVRVVVNESDICMVEFYGQIGTHEEQQLFNIVFGGNYGQKIGTIDFEGEQLNVLVMTFDLVFDDSWTEEEKNEAYQMQEDLNYILIEIEKVDGYTNN